LPVVVDTNVWIDWLTDQPGADRFHAVFHAPDPPLVPTIIIYEVLRWYRAKGLTAAAAGIAATLRQGQVVLLTTDIAEAAVELSGIARLAMADAIILASARARGAEFWTQDADFDELSGVRYFPKVSGG